MKSVFSYDSVELSENGKELVIIDQSLLPQQEKVIHLTTAERIFYAITRLKVRGAPAIGIAAVLGVAMCMNRFKTRKMDQFEKEFLRVKRYLSISRPTAVNLSWALDRMERCFYETKLQYEELPEQEAIEKIKKELTAEARSIKLEDVKMCLSIAENGCSILPNNAGILTYCNAGHLAVSRYGTALGPIYYAQQQGMMPKVYACETRPLLQGSRLTAFELMKAGVDVTLICDNMASIVMSQGKIDVVLFGCDRIAANGDVANKIGTSGLAILAKHYGIPCYTLGPTSSIDFNCKTGSDIVIEERPSYEVTDMYFGKTMAPQGIKVYNPAFDITPAEFISGIVTEKGIFKPSEIKKLKKLI